MRDIVLNVVHPAPSVRPARPGARPRLVARRIATPARIPVLPEGAMRPRAVPCMEADAGHDRANTYEHDGRLWWRMTSIRHEATGFVRRVPARLGEVIEALAGEGPDAAWNGFPLRTPLNDGIGWAGPGRPVPVEPGAEADLPFRTALARYLAEEVRACGDGLYLAAGLPCLAGTKAPSLAGAGPAWGGHSEWMLTRHDRVEDHVRHVGRLQRNDERERFRYFAGRVAEETRGLVCDDMAAGRFANGLARAAHEALDGLERRMRKRTRPDGADALAAARGRTLPWAVLGAAGAVAPADRARCIRDCLDALGAIPATEAAEAKVVREWRAFAEEVALPEAGCAPEASAADADVLAGLAP